LEFIIMVYSFAVLDPLNIPAATEANDKVFAKPVYGIEVTVPSLAERCTFNIDPQHTGGDANRAAIEDTLTAELPPEGSTLATVRADLDSVASMAILLMRAKARDLALTFSGTGELLDGVDPLSWQPTGSSRARIDQIAIADKFARGGYPGPKPLPTLDNPWVEETATAESSRQLAAIAAAVMDFNVPLADRVAMMEKWLLTGEEPKQYRESVEKERFDMINALATGRIKYETAASGRIAVVESTHRAATMVGYSLAPVVVAMNPAFRLGGGEAHVKFTVCAFEPKFADIKSALAELDTLEDGWGGSPTIGGSPQGVSSKLTIDEVVAVVEKHLLS
jgi:hypothetical protein